MPEVDECCTEEDISFLIDLLSHDVLNNNQAVLGYLDLIKSLPDMDERAKDCADRGISQLRTTSVIIEGGKRLLNAIRTGEIPEEAVGAGAVLRRSSEDLRSMFPHRKVEVDISGVDPRLEVPGGVLVSAMLGNLLANIVQLDVGAEASIKVTCSSAEREGEAVLSFRVFAKEIALPAAVDLGILDGPSDKDISRVGRVSGLVIAGRIARLLGGGLRCDLPPPREGGACAFELKVKGAGPR